MPEVVVNLAEKYTPHRSQVPFHADAGRVKFRGLFGGTGCLPVETLIWTPSGLKSISSVDRVLSWSFIENRLVSRRAAYFPSGLKQSYVFETDVGDLVCSGDHRWFVSAGNTVIRRAEDLKKGDQLLMVGGTVNEQGSRTKQPVEEHRQRPLYRPLLQQEIQYSENGGGAWRGSPVGSASPETLGYSISNLRGTVQNRTGNWEVGGSSPTSDDRGKFQENQKELLENSQGKLRMEMHDLWGNPDERALRFGGSSQGWRQSQQRPKEFDGSLSGVSLQTTRIRKSDKLKEKIEMGDLHVEDTHNFILIFMWRIPIILFCQTA